MSSPQYFLLAGLTEYVVIVILRSTLVTYSLDYFSKSKIIYQLI